MEIMVALLVRFFSPSRRNSAHFRIYIDLALSTKANKDAFFSATAVTTLLERSRF
jgi:hypothetical protein